MRLEETWATLDETGRDWRRLEETGGGWARLDELGGAGRAARSSTVHGDGARGLGGRQDWAELGPARRERGKDWGGAGQGRTGRSVTGRNWAELSGTGAGLGALGRN